MEVDEMADKLYQLQPLPYDYNALEPVISEGLLRLHHDKHHAAYVNGANAILQKLDKARKENVDLDMKAITKEFSFHFGGLFLHERFWQNMGPTGKAGGKPGGRIGDAIEKEFGSFERFKKEFTMAANSVEGSGWAVLAFCGHTDRPLIGLDVWEHAYYLDYKNDRAKFVENWWNLVNWDAVEKRMP
jgi:Fe-Mn family superoxide dismutase